MEGLREHAEGLEGHVRQVQLQDPRKVRIKPLPEAREPITAVAVGAGAGRGHAGELLITWGARHAVPCVPLSDARDKDRAEAQQRGPIQDGGEERDDVVARVEVAAVCAERADVWGDVWRGTEERGEAPQVRGVGELDSAEEHGLCAGAPDAGDEGRGAVVVLVGVEGAVGHRIPERVHDKLPDLDRKLGKATRRECVLGHVGRLRFLVSRMVETLTLNPKSRWNLVQLDFCRSNQLFASQMPCSNTPVCIGDPHPEWTPSDHHGSS